MSCWNQFAMFFCLYVVDAVDMQMLVSGGVDSTVCAALLHQALQHDQVIALHIDNGFMRQNESNRVEESLRALGLRISGMC